MQRTIGGCVTVVEIEGTAMHLPSIKPSRRVAWGAALALGVSCLVAMPGAAQATDVYNWTGQGDGYLWSDADNWSPAGVPSTQNDSVIISGDVDVTVDRNIDIFRVTLQQGATVYDSGGTLTTTQFEMAGESRLEMPIRTGSFAATGDGIKTIGSRGRVDATGVRSGEWGQATVNGGTLYIEAAGTVVKARVLSVSARVDGRGANLPTIDVQDATCPDPSITCGVQVGVNPDGRGVGLEGVTLVSSSIYFGQSATLSLREGLWKPRAGARVFTLNGAAGVLETGGPYPPDESGSPDQDVTLPTDLILDGVTWRHTGGAIAGNGTLSPGSMGSTFEWNGGSISGRVQARRVGSVGVSVTMNAPTDEPLELKGPARGGGSLALDNGGSIGAGTTLLLDAVSTLTNRGPVAAPFAQRPGSTITVITSSSSVSKVTNEGHWIVDADTIPLVTGVTHQADAADHAVIEYAPFTSTGTVTVEAGATLRLDGGRANSLAGKTTVNMRSATDFGSLAVGSGSTLKLGGALEVNATNAGLASGDEILIVETLAEEGEPSGISGSFSPITPLGLGTGLGLSGELIDTGYVVAVGAPEEMALTGKALARVRVRKPLAITYEVWNKSTVDVSPQLNLSVIKGARIVVPAELTCTQTGATYVCQMADMRPGEKRDVIVTYTFTKPGRQTIVATVTSAGYNPNPAGARSTLSVSVTR